MAESLDSKALAAVFGSRPDIIGGIKRAADSPERVALFNAIASHLQEQFQGGPEPALKKRRLEDGTAAADGANGAASASSVADAAQEPVLLSIKDISVSAPQRKKFDLCFTQGFLYARSSASPSPVPGMIFAWQDIEYVFYLPLPDKAQVQHSYVLFPRGTCLGNKTTPATTEPLVFTVPSTAPKEGTIGGSESGAAAAVSDTYRSLFHWLLDKRLTSAGNKLAIVSADAVTFQSVIRQAHRPNETAVHVAGFRGSKDGYLFFLKNGIFWGFKKPLLFIPLSRIAAVSYTNVLQITFNMVVEVFSGEGDTTEEFEFGMLDQQDYGGIDGYLKRNRLQDRSLAEQRKAKLQLAENRGPKGKEGETDGGAGAGGGGEMGEDGLSELQRAEMEAEQQLQDDEDAEEEDYDPGSDDGSNGSSLSGEEEGDAEEYDEGEEDEDAEGDEGEGEGEEEGEEGEEEVEGETEVGQDEDKPEERRGPPAGAQVAVRQGWATISRAPGGVDGS